MTATSLPMSAAFEKKIEDDPSRPEYIQTVRGVGYRMNMVKKE